MKNQDRVFVKLIREICADTGTDLQSFSYDWILQLTRGEKHMYIYGFQFPVNDAAAQLICGDKAGLAEVLRANGIPAAVHEFFMPPSASAQYTGGTGNWERLSALLKQHGRLVLKRNSGSGGTGVYLVQNQGELEAVSGDIFRGGRYMAVCPYYEIENEFRLIILNGQVRVVYRKMRPEVTGDGEHSVAQLIRSTFGEENITVDAGVDVDAVPAAGELVRLNWKHNLGQGAHAELLEEGPLKERLIALAGRAAKCINIRFASVDIISVGGELMVLEINSGIMTEAFALSSAESYQQVKALYSDAIDTYFASL